MTLGLVSSCTDVEFPVEFFDKFIRTSSTEKYVEFFSDNVYVLTQQFLDGG